MQLSTTAIFPDTTQDLADNPTDDVTLRSQLTVYRSSNPAILTVSKDGLAIARGKGRAIVTAVNSMVSGSLEIVVDTSVGTTVEGIVRRPDQSPVTGATITTPLGSSATTDAQGRFRFVNILFGGRPAIDLTVNGPPVVSRTVPVVVGGVSDAGIILLGVTTNVGNEFIVLFEQNFSGGPQQTLFMTAPEAAFGTIESAALANPISFQIAAGGVTKQVIDTALMLSGSEQIENKAIRVTADKPFRLYGLSQNPATTDAYTAIPVESLGSRYRVMSYPSVNTSGSNASQFAIAGTSDATTVTITPRVTVGSHAAGVPYSISLNRLQTYQLQANTAGADLTGSLIVADKPVAVFSGHSCGNVPLEKAACDHMIEQMPSVDTWGSSFITVSLATRIRGDIIRILANDADTVIQVRGNSSFEITLNAGQTKEFIAMGIHQITASKPVLVAQYSQSTTVDNVPSDPFMMVIPPTIQFLDSYLFATPSGMAIENHFVNIVSKSTDAQNGSVLLDGNVVPAGSFTGIDGSDYSAARVPITEGNHRFASPQPSAIYVYGFGFSDSYGYPGGLGLQRITP